jgi:hypothetical protein
MLEILLLALKLAANLAACAIFLGLALGLLELRRTEKWHR